MLECVNLYRVISKYDTNFVFDVKSDILGFWYLMKKWAASAWAKKLAAHKTRSDMGDFDRFKLMVARKKRSHAVKACQSL